MFIVHTHNFGQIHELNVKIVYWFLKYCHSIDTVGESISKFCQGLQLEDVERLAGLGLLPLDGVGRAPEHLHPPEVGAVRVEADALLQYAFVMGHRLGQSGASAKLDGTETRSATAGLVRKVASPCWHYVCLPRNLEPVPLDRKAPVVVSPSWHWSWSSINISKPSIKRLTSDGPPGVPEDSVARWLALWAHSASAIAAVAPHPWHHHQLPGAVLLHGGGTPGLVDIVGCGAALILDAPIPERELALIRVVRPSSADAFSFPIHRLRWSFVGQAAWIT